MAQGGSGWSRFSPFNLFFEEVSSAGGGTRDQVRAMQIWNNLGPQDKRRYELQSEYIKETLKTKAYEAEEEPAKLGVDRGVGKVDRLQSVIRGGNGRDGFSDSLRRSMKLICLQYSAHYQKKIESSPEERKRAGSGRGGVEYESRYLPNEVAVVTFSFLGGIERESHCFLQIPSEDIPAYCQAEMRERCQEVHFIPFDEEGIRLAGLAPIEPVASKVLEKMLGDVSGEDETLTFCLSADREIFHGSVKTLLDYAISPDQAQSYRRRMNLTCDLEDLLYLMSSSPNRCGRQELADKFKDQFVDDSRASLCSCDYHREREETEIQCALLRAHSAIHLVFDTLGKELDLTLTRRHIHVGERLLARCSASYYAAFPEAAPEEDQIVWTKSQFEDSFDINHNEGYDGSPKGRQLLFLKDLLNPLRGVKNS